MSYIFKKVKTDDDQLNKYASFLSSVFNESNKFSFKYLKWQYHDNPHGFALGYDAYLADELAAHYVTIPVSYSYNNKVLKGLLSLNTATHPKHQGNGLFTKLANKTYELAREKGYDFVIGVANQNSTHGFVKKLGFTLISPLEVKTGSGSIVLNNEYAFKSNWDSETLNWRLNHPLAKYIKKRDFILVKTDKPMYAQLININTKDIDLKTKLITPFKLWIGIAKNKKSKGLFVNLPDKFKPSPLNLIFKSLKPEINIPNKDIIRFELIDFDVY